MGFLKKPNKVGPGGNKAYINNAKVSKHIREVPRYFGNEEGVGETQKASATEDGAACESRREYEVRTRKLTL